MSDLEINMKIVIYGSENPHMVILRQIEILKIRARMMGGITEKTRPIMVKVTQTDQGYVKCEFAHVLWETASYQQSSIQA